MSLNSTNSQPEQTTAATNHSTQTLPAAMSCDVAIVGYGPVGMIAAAMLARRGLKIIVVERWPTRYNLPRAGHFDGETFRTFQSLGIAEEMELIARPMIQWKLVTGDREVLATIKLGEGGAGWKESYLTFQPEFEIIFDRLAQEHGVRVFMGVSAFDIEQNAQGVRLQVRPTEDAGAAPCVISASYILGADGANSFVRKHVGIERHDLGFSHNDELVIDFEHNDPDRDLPQLPEVFQVLDANRPELAGRWSGSRWSRFEFHALEGESREYLESEDTCWNFLAKWGIYPGDGKIIRHSVYSFESRMASAWRMGRVLLIGDAAHTMPPFMGQGLCSGIRDALNLSWKLPAVLAGEASEDLLDTYESEREPHVKAIIDMSIAVGNMSLMMDPEQARQRDEMLRSGKMPPAPTFPRIGPGMVRSPGSPHTHPTDGRPSLQARVALGKRVDRLDQFLRPGWKIVSRHPTLHSSLDDGQRQLMEHLNIDTAHISRGATAQYADIDAEYDLWYRNTGRKVFLIRPDNYVFGSAETMDGLPALLDELAVSLEAAGWKIAQPVKA